jgi:hypothetical protein
MAPDQDRRTIVLSPLERLTRAEEQLFTAIKRIDDHLLVQTLGIVVALALLGMTIGYAIATHDRIDRITRALANAGIPVAARARADKAGR